MGICFGAEFRAEGTRYRNDPAVALALFKFTCGTDGSLSEQDQRDLQGSGVYKQR